MILPAIIFLLTTIFFIFVVVEKVRGQQRNKMNDYVNAGIFVMLYAIVVLQSMEVFIKLVKGALQ